MNNFFTIKKIFFLLILFSLLLAPLAKLAAQSNATDSKDISFKSSDLPQWAKDIRRFDIITFGVFPFSMLFTTIFYDIYLRNNPIGFTGSYYGNVLIIAGGVSLTLALIDLLIVIGRRNRVRRSFVEVPSGTYEIERRPYGEPEPDESPPDDGLPDDYTDDTDNE